jgi:energy-coupling factor transporter ATP-binding protein EcfA2
VDDFFQKLVEAVAELRKLASESSSGADFQAMLTASPTKGITVSDLWAAHSSRKAWAIKGANIQCQNGEVCIIIGADGSGKTRLLTAIAEHMFPPPKSARTTTHVRGSINLSGVDASKWDRNQLKKRVGVLLNDVRTVSDYASLMAGCTLEEILEPVLEGGCVGPKERNSMFAAIKVSSTSETVVKRMKCFDLYLFSLSNLCNQITGLGSKILVHLPSKLSTVVSPNEDDLKPSSIRPPAYPLSPSDWSRVLLTKILAQVISGNENQPSSPTNVRKCMVGSILLLDDATSQMSEEDEAQLITALRSTDAAVVLTSNRWATGRFADRIVVVDGGSVVESGTHTDLLNLGPERSVYARHWRAISAV